MAYGSPGRGSGGGGGRFGNRDGGGGGFNRGGGGGFRRSFDGPRQMTKITCSSCGNEGEVPFKPREGTPVYCRDCFMKQKGKSESNHHAPKESKEENAEASGEESF